MYSLSSLASKSSFVDGPESQGGLKLSSAVDLLAKSTSTSRISRRVEQELGHDLFDIAGFSLAVVKLQRGLRHLLSTEISTVGTLVCGSARTSSRDLTPSSVYTSASSPSLFSSLLSALCAAGHIHASADAASSIIASASHVRIFQRGLSLQRLAKYSEAASALANATAAFLTSTGRGISLLSLTARDSGSVRLPKK
jgi:hypothetical protein